MDLLKESSRMVMGLAVSVVVHSAVWRSHRDQRFILSFKDCWQ